MNKIWTRGGLVLTQDGKVSSCIVCPCESALTGTGSGTGSALSGGNCYCEALLPAQLDIEMQHPGCEDIANGSSGGGTAYWDGIGTWYTDWQYYSFTTTTAGPFTHSCRKRYGFRCTDPLVVFCEIQALCTEGQYDPVLIGCLGAGCNPGALGEWMTMTSGVSCQAAVDVAGTGSFSFYELRCDPFFLEMTNDLATFDPTAECPDCGLLASVGTSAVVMA